MEPIKSHPLRAFVSFIVTFLVVDAVWIGLAGLKLYENQIGHLLAEKPNMLVAGLFYLGYAAGSIKLVVSSAESIKQTFFNGAILGSMAYGTYAVTNYAMLEGWTLELFIIDTLWGAFITSISSAVAYWFYRR